MASTIDDGTTTLDFITLHGEPQPLGEQVNEITRPNADGKAYRKTGKRAGSYTMISLRDVATTAAVKTTYDTYRTFLGSLCTVTDDLGNARSNVMVRNVEQMAGKAIAVGTGGLESSPAAVLRCRWTLEETTIP